MNVSDLIEALNEHPHDMPVFLHGIVPGRFGEVQEDILLSVVELPNRGGGGHYHPALLIGFEGDGISP